MTDNTAPVDAVARERALDPDTSFIVQAPAGSGKTGLLTQRYLRLLARVESPEEIIAITFTRKAAGEMRERIPNALASARSRKRPDDPHNALTWALAGEALEQDERLDWQLLDNPSRLRIQTIDSLCQSLARQTPLLSRFGAMPGVTEDARPYYLEAAQAVLDELEAGDELADAIAQLLRHRDNRMDDLQSLIAAMLARRDQWLRLVAPHAIDDGDPLERRMRIEEVLTRLVEEGLEKIETAMPEVAREMLPDLAAFAAQHVKADTPVRACLDMERLPGSSTADLPLWQCISGLLLTKGNKAKWRSPGGINKSLGFPAESSGGSTEEKHLFRDRKQAMQQLLESMQGHAELEKALANLSFLPTAVYTDEEWQLLDDLFRLLLRSVLQLQLVFSQRGEVDFIEMALSADEALGEVDDPSDLMLRLDYRISHLLVDEFQDTSQNQYRLFRKLVAGWEQGDGRTLFLVGDPMQSIYRFREAEVGLFLQAWEGRLGDVPLERLVLSVNFRSQRGIIDWVNHAFPQIMPLHSDKVHGAVEYTRSDAYKPALAGPAVEVHALLDTDEVSEAEHVLRIIDEAEAECPDGSIAILLRSKAHVADVVRLLKQQHHQFQAVEIDRLSQRPVVRDLLSLSCALLHAADRISWLAILRAPWCGLALEDLHALAGGDLDATIFDLVNDPACIARLSDDGAARLQRVLPVLSTAMSQRGRKDLRSWIEGAWIALGGPACVAEGMDLEDAEVFLQLLESIDSGSSVVSPELLNDKAAELFALPDAHASGRLQIMTMHKAKGLEFDTVILPGLGKSPRSDDPQLLYWMLRTGQSGEPELVFGPIKSAREKENRTAEFIKQLDREKSQYEYGRLLYVAATRARKRLHLLGEVKTSTETGDIREPGASTLLYQFWPVISDTFMERANTADTGDRAADDGEDSDDVPVNHLRRLQSGWTCPAPPRGVAGMEEAAQECDFDLEFDWAGESARLVGTVVHRILEQLGSQEMANATELERFSAIGRRMLMQEGLPAEQLDAAAGRIDDALAGILQDQRGRWILSTEHKDAQCEYALTWRVGDQVRHMIIDRTFIDANDDRWIIDYKTGSHTGGGMDEFLDREQERYRQQLDDYAAAFSRLEGRPIRLGLYFPLLNGWREWRYKE